MHPRLFPFALALGAIAQAVGLATEPAIREVKDQGGKIIAIEGIGLSKETLAALSSPNADELRSAQILSLYVVGADGLQPPAMAGRREVVGDALRFTPAYPLRAGMKYEVRFAPPPPGAQASPALVKREINIPALPRGEPARVTAIFPSAATLPENQLRFYVHFSAPMSRGEAFSHLKLLKANGQPIERAFLEISGELWDPAGQRLTVLLDPGRVKQGLKPREEFGPVLVAGEKYVLKIDAAWKDAQGQPLAAGFEKRFAAGPMIEAAVDAKQWQVTPPAAGSRDPLVVRFPRPLDHALLRRMIAVAGPDKRLIAGDIATADDERRWEFRPDQPWTSGGHELVVDTALEDTAGNNLARPFEIDVFEKIDSGPAVQFVRIPFAVSAK